MFARVLVPVDGSTHANTAAQLAAFVTDPAGELTLLHVSPDTRGAAALFDAAAAVIGGAMGDLRDKQALMESQAATRILEEARALIRTRPNVRTEQRIGRPAGTVLDQLDQQPYDSVVVGTRGRSAFARAVLGSVSDGVLRHAAKPAIIARHPRVTSVLAAVDGSQTSLRAFQAAAALAQRLAVPLTVVLVGEMEWAAPPEAQQAETANERREYEDLLAGMTPSPVVRDRVVLLTNPAEGILETAAAKRADLIVMGRTGQTPHPRMGLGSVAARVALHADASVLVVP